MGRLLAEVVCETAGVHLAAASVRPGSPLVGEDVGALIGKPAIGVRLQTELSLNPGDVIIDFSATAATLALAQVAANRGIAMVIGTTGFSVDERATLHALASRLPLLISANMSLGVNVLLGLLATATRQMGADYDVEIVELHHRHKRDAPSGTALAMGQAIASARQVELAPLLRHGRAGQVGERSAGEIGMLALRGGDIVGEHTAYFCGRGERLELTHKASSRRTFAEGAVRAAKWLSGQPAGLYDMQDVLGLK